MSNARDPQLSGSHARVSYILTTRNRARFLDSTLQNVREFITPSDELIVIDGGSTDETSAVVEKHRDIVAFFKSERDCGEAHGLNKGILESTGRYIKLITDDDYFYPDAMHRAIDAMESHPELDALLCGGEEYRVDPIKNEQKLTRYQQLPASRSLMDDADNVSLHVSCGIGLLLTRRVVARVGLFDPSFHAVDLDYLARLMSSGVEFKYLDVKLWRHLNHPGSGENDLAKCEWDRIRASLRDRAWDKVMTQPTPRIERVLGLDTISSGPLLARILKEVNWLRLKMPRLLLLLTGCLSFFHRCCQIAGRVLRLRQGLKQNQRATDASRAATVSLTEPEWDGSLR